jgi:hypothetical protein
LWINAADRCFDCSRCRFDATDATQAKVDAFAKAIEDKKEKEAAEAALKRQKSLKLFDEPVLNADGSRYVDSC